MEHPLPSSAGPSGPGSDADRPALPEPPRRSFLLGLAAAAVSAVIGLVPLIAGVVFFLDPLRRKPRHPAERPPKRDADGFVRVTTLDALPQYGQPRKFVVIADQVDAWNYVPEERIGNVILRRATTGDVKTSEDILAFTDVCPHLGCAVDFRAAEGAFHCPCHDSTFSLTGERQNNIPPRDLDRLEVDLRGNEIWVKYLKFRVGDKQKSVIG